MSHLLPAAPGNGRGDEAATGLRCWLAAEGGLPAALHGAHRHGRFLHVPGRLTGPALAAS